MLHWKGKEEERVFFSPIPENKEDKKTSEQAWIFLVFLLPTAHNSACL